jgi:hypothetical protein
LHSIGWERITLTPGAVLSAWWMDARCQVRKELRKGFELVVLLVSWLLWKECNSRVFDNVASTAAQAARKVLDEGDEEIAAGFTALLVFLVAAVVH